MKDSNDFNSNIPLDFFFPLSMPALNNFCFSLITRSLSPIIFFGTTCQWMQGYNSKHSTNSVLMAHSWSHFHLKLAEEKHDASPFSLGICASGILKLRMTYIYFSITMLKMSKTPKGFWMEENTSWICIKLHGLDPETPTFQPACTCQQRGNT